jgi:hypothetical protein
VTALTGWFECALPGSPYRDATLSTLTAAASDDVVRNLSLSDLCQRWAEQAANQEILEQRRAVRQELLRRYRASSDIIRAEPSL